MLAGLAIAAPAMADGNSGGGGEEEQCEGAGFLALSVGCVQISAQFAEVEQFGLSVSEAEENTNALVFAEAESGDAEGNTGNESDVEDVEAENEIGDLESGDIEQENMVENDCGDGDTSGPSHCVDNSIKGGDQESEGGDIEGDVEGGEGGDNTQANIGGVGLVNQEAEAENENSGDTGDVEVEDLEAEVEIEVEQEAENTGDIETGDAENEINIGGAALSSSNQANIAAVEQNSIQGIIGTLLLFGW